MEEPQTTLYSKGVDIQKPIHVITYLWRHSGNLGTDIGYKLQDDIRQKKKTYFDLLCAQFKISANKPGRRLSIKWEVVLENVLPLKSQSESHRKVSLKILDCCQCCGLNFMKLKKKHLVTMHDNFVKGKWFLVL